MILYCRLQLFALKNALLVKGGGGLFCFLFLLSHTLSFFLIGLQGEPKDNAPGRESDRAPAGFRGEERAALEPGRADPPA